VPLICSVLSQSRSRPRKLRRVVYKRSLRRMSNQRSVRQSHWALMRSNKRLSRKNPLTK
jgi:hypothetical protein